jgi:hypothetical protein
MKSRLVGWVGHVACTEEMRNSGNLKEETLARPRHRWEDNIKMYLEEIGCDDVE